MLAAPILENSSMSVLMCQVKKVSTNYGRVTKNKIHGGEGRSISESHRKINLVEEITFTF